MPTPEEHPDAAVLQLTSDQNPPQLASQATQQVVNPQETKCRLWDTPIST